MHSKWLMRSCFARSLLHAVVADGAVAGWGHLMSAWTRCSAASVQRSETALLQADSSFLFDDSARGRNALMRLLQTQVEKPNSVAVLPVRPLTDKLEDFLEELRGVLDENQITQRPISYVLSSNTSLSLPLCEGQVRAIYALSRRLAGCNSSEELLSHRY